MSDAKISEDERYPFYSNNEEWGEPVGEVPADTLKRWKQVMDAFEKVQDEMEVIFTAARARKARQAAIAKVEKEVQSAQERLDTLRRENGA